MVAFDVATAVADFLADSERTSLELPHMTTGQRKNAKKLLEQYPELTCESFGFGAERQLHLFKKCASNLPQEANQEKLNLASPDRSTTASSQGSPVIGEKDASFVMMHEELQVRNTFIHYEERAPIDERAVQSMPHGMFRQCIKSEMSQYVPRPEPTASAGLDAAPEVNQAEDLPLSPGALVVVEGLVKVPAFNGRSAVVQGFDEATGRYEILFASSDGSQQAKVKAEHLRVVLPCP